MSLLLRRCWCFFCPVRNGFFLFFFPDCEHREIGCDQAAITEAGR
jgi:hypothetical protein